MFDCAIPEIKKDNCFNAIRLFCCLIVIFEHAVVLTNTNINLIGGGFRDLAVDVFFILSGFWITISLFRSNSVKEYVVKRIKKIFPMYLIVIITFSILFYYFSNLSFSEYFTSSDYWKYLLCNVLTLNFIQPSLPTVFNNVPVNGSLWTIKVEIGFYILLPIFFVLIGKICKQTDKKTKYINIGLMIFYFLSIVYDFFMPIVCKRLNLPVSLSNQLPAYLSYFIAGMFFVINWDFLNNHIDKFILPAIAIVILHFFIKTSFLLPIALCVVVMFFAFRLPILNNIGKTDYSYGMYLVHYPIILVLNYYNLFESNFVVAVIATIGISFMVAYLLEIIQKKIK